MFPDHFPYSCTFAGEAHGRWHVQHADKVLNLSFIYMGIFVHFGVKGLSTSKMVVKDMSRLENWTNMIMAGTIMWLRRIYTESELKNIQNILKKVSKNLPVYNHIGWLFHYGTFMWGNKKAVRVGDYDRLDFMWKMCLYVFQPTNKYSYKKGCLQQCKLLFDSVPLVRKIAEHWRTVNMHGYACSGQELDMAEEKVVAQGPRLSLTTTLLTLLCIFTAQQRREEREHSRQPGGPGEAQQARECAPQEQEERPEDVGRLPKSEQEEESCCVRRDDRDDRRVAPRLLRILQS